MSNPNPDIFLPNEIVGIASTLLSTRPVADGERVNATVTNRLPTTNYANASYIHDLLKKGYNNSAQFLYDQYIADDVQIGDFVFYNFENRVFEKGLAKFVQIGGTFLESPATAVWGVVTIIQNGKATICTDGLCSFIPQNTGYNNLDMPNAIFLSNFIPGAPTTTIHYPYKCLGTAVGQKDTAEVQLFLRAGLHADARIHDHQSYMLAAAPAGNWDIATPDIITNPKLDLPGWLPANHSIFGGTAPINAKYGYNPKFLEDCNYPPQAIEAAGLRWQRKSATSDDPVIANVPSELYKFTNKTIWWLFDKAPFLPWDSTLSYANGEPTDTHPHPYRQKIWYENMCYGYGMEESVVASLRAVEGSGLRVRQFPTGGEATTGELEIDYHPNFTADSVIVPQYTAVHDLVDRTIHYTYNVAGLRIDSKQLKIIESDFVSPEGFYSGNLTITDYTGAIGQELAFEAVHLNGVEEAVERDVVGLSFPPNRPGASLLARIPVPLNDSFSAFDMSLIFGILLPQQGSVSAGVFTVGYKVVPNPLSSAGKTLYNAPIAAFPNPNMEIVPCNFTCKATTASYYLVESNKFRVKQGDIVMVQIERVDKNYDNRIIFLRKSAKLYLPNN
jgi:hypothetical protein